MMLRTMTARVLLLPALVLFTLAAHAAALWGPVLADVTPTTALIRWRDGDTPSDGLLLGGKVHAAVTDADQYRTVTLENLKPDTDYTYGLKGTKDTYTFHTAPKADARFSFVAYGDTRTNLDIHQQLVEAMLPWKPRFVINTGDLVAQGKVDKEWDGFFGVARALTASAPYFAAAGNHEQNAGAFFKLFPGASDKELGYYAFTYGSVRVIMLDSNREIATQAKWLEATLAAPTPAKWTVVAFHHPPYTSGARGGNEAVVQQWVPLFEKYHVDVAFLGHDHFYEHSERNGVHYFICGGGGAPLYANKPDSNPYAKTFIKAHHYMRVDVSPTELRLSMIQLDGKTGDTVVLKK